MGRVVASLVLRQIMYELVLRVRARMHNKSEVPKISGHNQMRKNGGIP